MFQRAALSAGEDCRIDFFRQFLAVGQNHSAAGAAQGFVGGGGDNVGAVKRVGMAAAGNQTGKMRHVDHQISSRFIGNLAETGKVYLPRVGGTAGDDQFGLMFFGQPFDFVIINQTVFFAYAVLYGVQPFAGNGNFGAVSQMPAGVERHAENGVTGLKQGNVNGGVGL